MKRGQEDYLRTILELDTKEGVSSISIAKELGISKASVSEMLKKLANNNLIKFEPYSNIFLTAKGKKIAQILSEKHKILEQFASKLKHTSPHEEAHSLEHGLSDEMFHRLSEFINGKTQLKAPPSYIS